MKYEIIIDKIKSTAPGVAVQDPSMLVVHHTAVFTEGSYDVIARLNAYANTHISHGNPGLAYHIYIPRDESDLIYVTRYFDQAQWHCGNGKFNQESLAICVEGDFTRQDPTVTQLKKLKKVLDDFPGYFKENSWTEAVYDINPRDTVTKRSGFGINLTGSLFGHKEVAEKIAPTACPGKLQDYVTEYRTKAGSVSWWSDTPVVVQDNTIMEENKILQEQVEKAEANIQSLVQEVSKQKELVIELSSELEAERMKNLDKDLTMISLEDLKITDLQKSGIEYLFTEFCKWFTAHWNKMPKNHRIALTVGLGMVTNAALTYLGTNTLPGVDFYGISLTSTFVTSMVIRLFQVLTKIGETELARELPNV